MDIRYDDLDGIQPDELARLKAKEDVIRSAMAKLGRTSVRWAWFDNGDFRLPRLLSGDDCIAQFRPQHFDLEPSAFESLIVEDQCPCFDIPRQPVYNNYRMVQVGSESVKVSYGLFGKTYKVWSTFRGGLVEGKGRTMNAAYHDWEQRAQWRARE
jgi:hypothetical protein